MDDQVERLANKAWTKFQTLDASQRLLIAIAGIPGSGKSTLAALVVRAINKLYHDDFSRRHPNLPHGSQPNLAIAVPLDGYHLTRQQLAEMANADEAIFRRGAAFTFDSNGYCQLVRRVRAPLEATTATIYAPSFDHAIKDPVAMDIGIPPTARIVVFEGLYVALDREGWRDAAELMDELWFLDVAIAVAAERVAQRNYAAGISGSLEESRARAEASDMRNGREILAERLDVQELIQSVEDEKQRLDSITELAQAGAGW
ncbi:hypothetical protein DV737_g5498, partial [Chaetothyriales sp. CBS 132003]